MPAIRIVDSIGAGDAFGVAFLARCLDRGLDRACLADRTALLDAVGIAIAAAAVTCRRAGADPPGRDELEWPAA